MHGALSVIYCLARFINHVDNKVLFEGSQWGERCLYLISLELRGGSH